MAIGGLVAVVVAQQDEFAVAGLPALLLHHAVAGGIDRRAARGRPVDAGMHLDVAENRVAAQAEAGAHHAFSDRLAHQELLRALAGFVVVVDDAVVRGLETIELLGLAAERECSKQHVAAVVGFLPFFLAGKEHLERIARLHLALEIDVE